MDSAELLSPLLRTIRCTIYADGTVGCGPADGGMTLLSRAAGDREVDVMWDDASPIGRISPEVRARCLACVPAAELLPTGPAFPPPFTGHAWNDMTRRGLISFLTAVASHAPEAAEEAKLRIGYLLNPRN